MSSITLSSKIPLATWSGAIFGLVTSARDPRIGQFALKFSF